MGLVILGGVATAGAQAAPWPPAASLPHETVEPHFHDEATLGRCDADIAATRADLTHDAEAEALDSFWASARAEGLARVRAGAAPVIYMHIFKSGGTSVCEAAKAANVSVPPVGHFIGNCNAPPMVVDDDGDLERSLSSSSSSSFSSSAPRGLLRAANAARWGFVAIEQVALPPADESGFFEASLPRSADRGAARRSSEGALASPRCAVWAVQLRDPRDRMLSHFFEAQAHYQCLAARKPRCAGQGAHAWSKLQAPWDAAALAPLAKMRLREPSRVASFATVSFAEASGCLPRRCFDPRSFGRCCGASFVVVVVCVFARRSLVCSFGATRVV